MSDQLHEEFICTDKRVDPLFDPFVNFPLEEIFSRLDGFGVQDNQSCQDQIAASSIRGFFLWVTDCRIDGEAGQIMVGRRFLTAAFKLNPRLFETSPDLEFMARQMGFSLPHSKGVSP